MNKLVLKSILPVLGIILGPVLFLAGLRSFAGWVLGSGIFGAVPLTILTLVVTTAIAFLIVYNSYIALVKVWKSNKE